MGVYEVEIGGKTYEVEAPDQGAALQAVRGMSGTGNRADGFARDTAMGSDGVSGDSIRSANAGDTRSQMRPQDIQTAYGFAQNAGNKPEQMAMARAFVDRERRDSPVTMGVSDRLRSVARGVPFIGEYLDEANAATAHPFDAKAREMRLDYERARDRTFDDANPIQSLAGKATGGIAGTVAALPVAAATGTSALLGAGAKSIGGAMGRGALAGTLQGAAAGYGRDNTIEGAMKDAAVGGAFGGGIPLALATGKGLVDSVASRVAPNDALSSVPTRARKFFEQQFSPDAMGKIRTDLDALGPQGVLADVSPEMQMMARGAAARPGSREHIVSALAARDKGKNARLSEAIDGSLGPVTEPSAINVGIREGMDGLGDRYGEVLRQNARRVDTQPIADSLDTNAVNLRGPAQKAVMEARKMLNIPGTQELDPSPNALFQTRQAIDGMVTNEANPKVLGELSSARRAIDGSLADAVPGIKQVDGQFQELARQRGALDEGSRLLRSGPEAIRPSDLAARLATAAEPAGMAIGPSGERLRLSQGLRAELDRIVGSNANDVSAMRNLLKGEGDWNRDKLRMVFGESKADKMLKALDNEGRMESTFRTVVGGSQTAPTQGFKDFLDETGKGVNIPAEASGVGLALRGGKKLVERIVGSNNEAKAEKFAGDLGRLSVAGGSEAQAIIDAIVRRQGKTQSSAALNEMFGRIGAGSGRADDPVGIKAAIIAAITAREAAVRSTGSPRKTSQREAR